MVFLHDVKLQAQKHGATVERVRFDRAPELRTDELKRRAAKELNILVELTAREHHEGVGRAERNNDLLTRMAEEMLQRAKLGTAWLLPARAYAQWLLNRTPLAKTGDTRYQQFRAEVPNFGAMLTPYIFGTTVAIVEDVKGPKGSLEHPRGSVGQNRGRHRQLVPRLARRAQERGASDERQGAQREGAHRRSAAASCSRRRGGVPDRGGHEC